MENDDDENNSLLYHSLHFSDMYRPLKTQAYHNTLKALNYVFIYPSLWEEKHVYFWYFSAFCVRLFGAFMFVMSPLHVTMSMIHSREADRSVDYTVITAGTNSVIICAVFMFSRKKWSRMFVEISDTKKFGKPPKLDQLVKENNLISAVYSLYCYTAIVIYCSFSYLDASSCKLLNEEKGLHEICYTVTPVWWYTDEISPPLLVVFNMLEIASIVCYMPPSGLISLLTWESSRMIQYKIWHLNGLFRSVFDVKDGNVARQRLRFCIQYHQEIIRLSDMLNKESKATVGHMGFITALALSCIGTQMLVKYSVGAFLYLIGVFVAIFVICQAGQRMMDETYSVQDAIYESKWYEMDPKLARDISLILVRSQKPVTIDATPFGVFNYGLLIIIVKTAYSYLTLMYNTN